MKPVALEAYELLADAYAAGIDTKPHNAYYERPAMLSLLPDVAGLEVLDAGCGPGAYTEWLVQHGASVIAVDASPRMLERARARVGNAARFYQADLSGELPFLADACVDLVLAPLVMDYLPDWRAVFARFHRALRPGGLLVFSTGHPSFDAEYHQTERYFEVEPVSCMFKGFGPHVSVPSFRRSLEEVINPLIGAGFDLVEIREPRPTPEFQAAEPVKWAKLQRHPCFLCLKARKREVRG